jgi:hypothetical protein
MYDNVHMQKPSALHSSQTPVNHWMDSQQCRQIARPLSIDVLLSVKLTVAAATGSDAQEEVTGTCCGCK